MNYRTLLTTAAVSIALAGLAGCGPDVDNTAVAPVEPVVPPVAAPEPVAPQGTAPDGVLPPPDADRSVGTVIDDATVTAKVKAALMAESGVDGTRINVDTTAGKVVLKGEVPSKTMIERALQVARGIEGVRDIDNQLTAVGAG
jgi:hyperosmotically inducible protein